MKSSTLWTVVALLFVTLGALWMRGDTDRVPSSKPLTQLPLQLGSWQGQNIPIPQATLDILGKGFFLNRVYTPSESTTGTPIGLLIAYFPTQRSGQSIHSPQNCLPGAGWSFESSGTTTWEEPSGRYRVGEYLISNGTDRQEVLYWYRSHGKNIANDYEAKFNMLKDSILYSRTDAALIRVITPVVPGESRMAAQQRAILFSKSFVPLLSSYIPD